MSKKNSGFSVAEQLLQGKQIKPAIQAKPEVVKSVQEPISPATVETSVVNTAINKTTKNLNIAFTSNSYKYLKLITLYDETDITKYINKLVERDRQERQGELSNIITT